jgi:hypothetical protein
MSNCPCGAALSSEAEWCPVCLKRVVDPEQLLDELHDTFRKTTFTPPEHLVASPPPKRFSRWEGGPLTFGPGLKVTLTVLVLGIVLDTLWTLKPWAWFLHHDGDHPARAFAAFEILLVVAGGAFFLRALWKRTRVE